MRATLRLIDWGWFKRAIYRLAQFPVSVCKAAPSMQDTPQTTRPGVAYPSFGSTILALGPGARLVRELQSGSPLKFNYYSLALPLVPVRNGRRSLSPRA